MSQASTYPLGTSGTALGVNAGGTVQRFTLREVLTADRTYYVSTTGSDSNDGLTTGTALATLQGAFNVVATIDFNGHAVTLSFAAGTYSGQAYAPVTVGQVAANRLVVTSTSGVASDVTLTAALSYAAIVDVGAASRVRLTNLTLSGGNTTTHHLYAHDAGQIEFAGLTFAGSGYNHIYAASGGSISCGSTSYTIAGGATSHWAVSSGGFMSITYDTITLSGTPAFNPFAYINKGGVMTVNGHTFSGTATGPRYSANNYGIIDTNGGGATYLPGNAAGTTSNGLYL